MYRYYISWKLNCIYTDTYLGSFVPDMCLEGTADLFSRLFLFSATVLLGFNSSNLRSLILSSSAKCCPHSRVYRKLSLFFGLHTFSHRICKSWSSGTLCSTWLRTCTFAVPLRLLHPDTTQHGIFPLVLATSKHKITILRDTNRYINTETGA